MAKLFGEKRRCPKAFFALVLLILIIGGIYYLPYHVFWNQEDVDNSLNRLATIYTCLTAVIGALIAGAAAWLSWNMHTEDRQAEVFSYWYKTIVLERYLEEIDQFFDLAEDLTRKFRAIFAERDKLSGAAYDDRLRDEVTTLFTERYTGLRRRLVFDLDMFDHDLSKKVSSLFGSVQDIFFKEIDTLHPNFNKMEEQIKEEKRLILKSLMAFDKSANSGSQIRRWFYQND